MAPRGLMALLNISACRYVSRLKRKRRSEEEKEREREAEGKPRARANVMIVVDTVVVWPTEFYSESERVKQPGATNFPAANCLRAARARANQTLGALFGGDGGGGGGGI